jgi:putative ABC transport system permease protein
MSGPANVLHDCRYAIRLLGNNRGFSAVAIATLALAIGANTAMFSFVNGMLLSPLPYPDSDRIVRVLERLPGGGLNGISTLNYLDWRNQNGVFEYIAAEAGWRPTLTGGEEPIVIRGRAYRRTTSISSERSQRRAARSCRATICRARIVSSS